MSDKKEFGNVSDVINNDTKDVSIIYKDKKFEFSVNKSLSSQELWRIIDDNLEDANSGDINLSGFVLDYLSEIIEDSTLDRPATALRKGDFEFSSKLMDEVGNPLEELEKLDGGDRKN